MTPVRWARAPERRPEEWRYIEQGLRWLIQWLVSCADESRGEPELGVMVEVGTYAGESAALFADVFHEVHCVDHWNDPIDHPSLADVVESFRVRADRAGNIIPHTCTSIEGAALFVDGSVDFVYIDADHRREAVLADIRSWWPKLKAGRWFGGHDYNNPDVQAAVRDYFGDPYQMGLITFPDFSWIVRKP